MFPCLGFGYGYWWIFPIIMIAMMVLCFFMMRGHAGSIMCSPGFGRSDSHSENASDRPLDMLNRKYAQGEINKQEYEEKKEDIARRT
jgi:putative membrane protein